MSIAEYGSIKSLESSRHYIFGYMSINFNLLAILMKDSIEGKLKVWIGSSTFEVGHFDDSLIRLVETSISAIYLLFHLVERSDSNEHFDIVAFFSH